MNWKAKFKSDYTMTGLGPLVTIPPPPKKEFQTMHDLLRMAEHWSNEGNKELEREVWKMISKQADKYAGKPIITKRPIETGEEEK